MAQITAALVKQLRDATNVSMMECKKALIEANADIDAATRLLRERGMAIAGKKASRATKSGLIASAATDGGSVVSLIEVACETDFVAKNDNFQAFVDELAQKACGADGSLVDDTKESVTAKIAEIGENIIIKRNQRFTLDGAGRLVSYIHLGGKVGVILEVGCEKEASATADGLVDLARDLSLHVAASSPSYLTSDDIPADIIAAERDIYAKQVENKPPQIVEKIVDGKLRKFFSEACLVDQGFVKDPDQTITSLLEAKGKELDDTITIRRFVRYQLGE